MQDKPHSNFDPRLMDRGWELLRPQLDEALPLVEERRRVAYYWWLLLGLFLLLAVSVATTYAYWNEGRPATETALARVSEQAIAAQSVAPIAADDTATASHPVMSASPQLPDEPVNFATALPATVPVMGPDEAADTAHGEEGPAPKALPAPVLAENSFSEEHQTNSLPPRSSSAVEAEVGRSAGVELEAVRAVPTLAATAVAPDVDSRTLSSAVTISLASVPRLQYFLTARWGNSFQIPYYSQLGAGLEGQLALSRKLRLSLGFHYLESWPRQQSDANEVLSGEFAENEEVSAPVFDTAGRLNVSSPVLEQLYTRQLGLEVRGLLRLSPRWQLGLGAELLHYRAAYLREADRLGISLGNTTGLDNFNVYDNEVRVVDASSEAAAGSSSTLPLELNRWQWAASAGLQYQLHRRWQLGLDWRQQLSALSPLLPDLETQSAVQLRLRYRLR